MSAKTCQEWLNWHKSSFSGSGQDDCIEIAEAPGGKVRLRESDFPDTTLAVPPTTLRALFTYARNQHQGPLS
ncbi:DUF397 domain-containing protein [Streptomyces sp. UNOC14_S4]|uniref:DUF397 domain-containing protein n=1 Tax=Streptomyces sp. UNOC14_S4 TaxID=2872340 RepID=UPI001E607A15|nr:DUF397 domain-containing protein [Streptomyces sp. UNOC14_S4]MCC3771014.1 DUF397 domain-containing protein [Streptomyces sp. UNOC14_S4]